MLKMKLHIEESLMLTALITRAKLLREFNNLYMVTRILDNMNNTYILEKHAHNKVYIKVKLLARGCFTH